MKDPNPDDPTTEPTEATEPAEATSTTKASDERAETTTTPGAVTLTKGGVSAPRRAGGRRLVAAAVAAVVVVGGALVVWQVTSGDDGDGETAEENDLASESIEEIGTQVNAAMSDLTSVHLVVDRGTGPSNLQIDLRINDAGECEGEFTGGGVTAEILSADDRVFLRPDAGYWSASGLSAEAAAEIVATADGRWIEGSSDPGTSSLLGICTDGVSTLAGDEFDPATFADAGWTVGEEGDVDGEPALALDKAGTTTAWIATEGTPWILLAESSGENAGTVRFSEHDEAFDFEVPADDEIVSEEELLPAVQ